MEGTTGVAVLVLVFGLTVGPILGLMLLLNDRDRRQAAALARMWDLTPRDLRDVISIQVRTGILSRRSVVTVDMGACSREAIWEAVPRWRAGLGPHVRLLVNGKLQGGMEAAFIVEPACRPPLCRPARPSVAAG